MLPVSVIRRNYSSVALYEPGYKAAIVFSKLPPNLALFPGSSTTTVQRRWTLGRCQPHTHTGRVSHLPYLCRISLSLGTVTQGVNTRPYC